MLDFFELKTKYKFFVIFELIEILIFSYEDIKISKTFSIQPIPIFCENILYFIWKSFRNFLKKFFLLLEELIEILVFSYDKRENFFFEMNFFLKTEKIYLELSKNILEFHLKSILSNYSLDLLYFCLESYLFEEDFFIFEEEHEKLLFIRWNFLYENYWKNYYLGKNFLYNFYIDWTRFNLKNLLILDINFNKNFYKIDELLILGISFNKDINEIYLSFYEEKFLWNFWKFKFNSIYFLNLDINFLLNIDKFLFWNFLKIFEFMLNIIFLLLKIVLYLIYYIIEYFCNLIKFFDYYFYYPFMDEYLFFFLKLIWFIFMILWEFLYLKNFWWN